ncbi:MAG: ABC transporter ATP-binding protein [Deltaproteobacteria bacterium]|nr:ABC transporter ATP-binding protein [Deltaproteobacteria bacterium]
MNILQVNKVSKYFGALGALEDVTITVKQGEIVGLVGPNGSGKSTLFNVISGVDRVTKGDIIFESKNITNLPSPAICRLGIGRTFQIVRPFLKLSVLENVMVGKYFGHPGKKGKFTQIKDKAIELLEFVNLADKKGAYPANLTLADRKKLEIARALATSPKLLLLDEVASGLNEKEVEEVVNLIHEINKEWKITLIVVEHVMSMIMKISDRIIVLSSGKKIADGAPSEVVNDKEVIEVYLGEPISQQ